MKQLKRFALTFAALALLAAALFCPAVSAANLDEIEKYFITVRLQPDGSADIDYDIHWKVLDSTSAGPLEWVKVGVPNDSIQPVSHHLRPLLLVGGGQLCAAGSGPPLLRRRDGAP